MNPRIEERDGLRWLVVEDGWSPASAALITSNQVDGIELNSSKGDWGDNLDFLEQVPSLRHLTLIDPAQHDVEPIGKLTNLESLRLSSYASSPLDFSGLRSLKYCFVEWRKHYLGLAGCTGLEYLYMNKYPAGDLGLVAGLTALQVLRIGNSRVFAALDGISNFTQLRRLGLYGLPRLTSLMPVVGVSRTLETLEVRGCRALGTLVGLEHLPHLWRLVLEDCGKVASIQPIYGLPSLRQFFFAGDTDILDGDLEALRSLNLDDVSFQNRRHYSLRRETLRGFKS